MSRYHGFTCPKCGEHYFTTIKIPPAPASQYPIGLNEGRCTANQYIANGCLFAWNRNDSKAESEAMYTQTADEWGATQVQFFKSN